MCDECLEGLRRVNILQTTDDRICFDQVFELSFRQQNINGAWRSLVACLHGAQVVAGSNPAVPIPCVTCLLQ